MVPITPTLKISVRRWERVSCWCTMHQKLTCPPSSNFQVQTGVFVAYNSTVHQPSNVCIGSKPQLPALQWSHFTEEGTIYLILECFAPLLEWDIQVQGWRFLPRLRPWRLRSLCLYQVVMRQLRSILRSIEMKMEKIVPLCTGVQRAETSRNQV